MSMNVELQQKYKEAVCPISRRDRGKSRNTAAGIVVVPAEV
jgi:hypothetical protein